MKTIEIEVFTTKEVLPENGARVLFSKVLFSKVSETKYGKFINGNETSPYFDVNGFPYWLSAANYYWCKIPVLSEAK